MRNNLVVLAVSVALSACGISTEAETGKTESVPLATNEQALTACWPVDATPLTPASPTDLRVWLRTHPQLFPVGLRSAYAVLFQDPANRGGFIALGYDVVARRNLFYVSGSNSTDLSVALTNLADGISLNVSTNPTFAGAGILGDVVKPPKGCCQAIPDEAFNKASGANFVVAQ